MTRIGLLCAALIGAATPVMAQDTLLMTSLTPAGTTISVFYNNWAQKVNEAAKGAIKVEVKDGFTLATFANTYDRTMADVVQIGWAQPGIVAGKFPLSDVSQLPFVVDDNEACSVASWRYYKSGILNSEYTDIVPLFFGCLGLLNMHFSKAPPTLEQLNGQKISGRGKVPSRLIALLGGTPLSVPPEDMYPSLQRGTLNAVISSWGTFEPYRLAEVSFHHLEAPLGASPSMLFMSKKKYDALPAAGRKALDDNSGEAMSRAMGREIEGMGQRGRASVTGAPDKHKVVQLTPELRASWEKKTAAAVQEWAQERPNGEKAIETYRKLYADVKANR
jgi:TRAP-type C4-dicarboxylate transport system substrate-binding protein